MTYLYECVNEKCSKVKVGVSINKPMSECGEEEHCKRCNNTLNRVYKVSTSTSDGFKL